MTLLITICARGGSKGIPGKNIKILNGLPLIAYTINIAKNIAEKYNAVIALSTDDKEILNVSTQYGLNTEYKRPLNLASDTAGKIDTIKDLLLYEERRLNKQFDFVLDLDVTSPLRTFEDIEIAFQKLRENKDSLSIFSVNKAARNPYFNMVERGEGEYVRLVKKNGSILTRQNAPEVYDLNASFYFYRRAFFDMKFNTPITEKSLVYVMPHLCFDLDHTIDFELLQYLLENDKLDFKI